VAREDLVGRTFVELADTLVEDYDPIEFLHRLAERCVSVLGIAEAGLSWLTLGGSCGHWLPRANECVSSS